MSDEMENERGAGRREFEGSGERSGGVDLGGEDKQRLSLKKKTLDLKWQEEERRSVRFRREAFSEEKRGSPARYLLSWWCVVSLLVISAGDKFCARDLLLILSRFLLVVQLRLREKRRLEKAGSSFPLKKTINVLPKIQLSDESDIIVGDCEVGSTRKACKNCTCGRAKAEEKVEKLTLTAEQITNPQSACGNFVVGLGDKVSPTDIEEGMPVG
ncbi:anamorsin [Carex littledalei]|uniref:Anamorsin n=1 Tax=Carex littledalei TaxID=544730 RepID=A0A833QYE6_9POAL|nr:anamorsin [Carex littledalei]